MSIEKMNFSFPSKEITYAEAIRLSIGKIMSEDESVLVYGLGVDDVKAMYGTLQDFPDIFGFNRCFDTPLSEDSLTGYGIGLAISGFKPIHVHQRTDFLLLCCNQLINMAAKVKYLSDGFNSCPFVVRAITGRSWGQGSQHSQSFHSLFSNIPGLRVLTPSTPNDVYNTYLNVFSDSIPTLIVEHRMLYKTTGTVKLSANLPSISRISGGDDITICSISHMTLETQKAIKALACMDISCDHFSVVNHSNLKLDEVLKSANKTGNLLIVDHGWLNSSIASTIHSRLNMMGFEGQVEMLGYADTPCPTSKILEQFYYPSPDTILHAIAHLLKLDQQNIQSLGVSPEISTFKGPF